MLSRNRVYSFLIMLLFVELCFSNDSNSTISGRGSVLVIPEVFNFLSSYNNPNWDVGDENYVINMVMLRPPRAAIYKNEYFNGIHAEFELSIYEDEVGVTSNAVSTYFQNGGSVIPGTKVHTETYTTSYSDANKIFSIFNKLKNKRNYLVVVKYCFIESLITFYSTLELFVYDKNYGRTALLEREDDLFSVSIVLFALSSIYPNKLIESIAYANAFSYYASAIYRVSRSTIELYFQEKEELCSFTLIYSLFLSMKFSFKYFSFHQSNTSFQILLLLSFPYFYSRTG